ncbi:MAG: carboxypeptidase regulatory-like domain-containing protein [Planctomycetota bacterium]
MRAEDAANLLVEAVPVTGTLPPRMQLRDDRTAVGGARTDAAGAFRIDGVAAGPTRVQVALADGRVASTTVIVTRDTAEGPVYLRADVARADAGDAVTVHVVDREGNPVAGAEVELFAWSVRNEIGNRIEDPRREPLARASTGDDGTVRWNGLGVRSGFAYARRDGAVGQAHFDLGVDSGRRELPLEVLVGPGVDLRGVLEGGDAASLRDAVVTLHAMSREGILWGGSRAFDTPVKGSEFAFAALPPGLYGVTLRAPGGARLVVPTIGDGPDAYPNSARMRVVGIERGRVTEARLPVVVGPRLRGRVMNGDSPVAGARVRAVLAPRNSNDPAGFVVRGVHVWRFDQSWENCLPDPLTHVDTVTDRDGRYELTSLQPGRHRVEVVANGLSYDRRMDVALADGETVELEHELVPAGILQVAGLGLGYVGVLVPGSQDPEMIAVIPGEHVTFPGLRPGRWQVARCHSDSKVAPVVVGEAEVVAGRTTWLDLRAATVAAVVHGVVTSGGAPVVGAGIEHWPSTTRTDAFGAFRMVFGNPVRIGKRMFGRAVRVDKGGVQHEWYTASSDPQSEVECAVELGTRRLRVLVVDEHGAPVAAKLRLDGALEHEMPGVDRVGIDTGVPAAGAEFGPLPACELRGSVTFADDLAIPVAIPADATEWRIERVTTVPLVTIVRDGNGLGLPRRNVVACRWTGSGPAPDDPKLFVGAVEVHGGKTGDDGVLRLMVPPGEYAVYASAFLSQSAPVRLRVEGAATPTVELEMK